MKLWASLFAFFIYRSLHPQPVIPQCHFYPCLRLFWQIVMDARNVLHMKYYKISTQVATHLKGLDKIQWNQNTEWCLLGYVRFERAECSSSEFSDWMILRWCLRLWTAVTCELFVTFLLGVCLICDTWHHCNFSPSVSSYNDTTFNLEMLKF